MSPKFFITIILCVSTCHTTLAAESFQGVVLPILKRRCIRCHGPQKQNAEIRLDNLTTDMVADGFGTETWHDVLNAVNKGEMPPEDEPQLTSEERQTLINWITGEFARVKQARQATGGSVVMRRLNKSQYQNTMRDLLGIDLNFTKNLPPDSLSQDGFRNNGTSLQMSALQLEYYLKAAREALARAVVEGPAPTVFTHAATESVRDKGAGNWTNRLGRRGEFVARIPEFPDEGEFVLKLRARAEIPNGAGIPALEIKMGFRADVSAPSKVVDTFDIENSVSTEFEFRGRFEEFPIQSRTQSKYPGMLIWIRNISSNGKDGPKPVQVFEENAKGKKKKKPRTVWPEDPEFPQVVIESVEFTAPVYASWPPQHHRNIIVRTPTSAADERMVAAESLQHFVPRAFRRPITDGQLNQFLSFYDTVRPTAGSFESTMRQLMALVLISPNFLYLTEPQRDKQQLNDYELASRLSYFLWNTMPDQQLVDLAAADQLHDTRVLQQQTERLLADHRSSAFVEQFVTQWLDLGGVDRVAVNPEFYPEFDNALKSDMQQETQHVFAEVLHNDISALELLNGDFTMLNESLARHYGVLGIKGRRFQKVNLLPEQRPGGILGHAAILLANSTGDDSHAIKRAVWIRERILDDPPAPPPPDVPALNQELPDLAALPLKRQLELHRENEACARCHKGIDGWGVAMEEFDAVGLRRDTIRRRHPSRRGKFVNHPVDAQGELPDGTRVNGLAELTRYLATQRSQDFARTIVVKLLTYALGRSLEFSDEEIIDDLTRRFIASDYQLRTLVALIVTCQPFRNG